MVLHISWKNSSGRHCLCSRIRLKRAILTQYEGAGLPHMVLLAYCCITDRCVYLLMHKPAAARGMWRGSQAGGMTCFMSDWLSLAGKIVFGICLTLGKWACAHVCVCVCECVRAALHYPHSSPRIISICLLRFCNTIWVIIMWRLKMLQYHTEWLNEYIKLVFSFHPAALCACNAYIVGSGVTACVFI